MTFYIWEPRRGVLIIRRDSLGATDREKYRLQWLEGVLKDTRGHAVVIARVVASNELGYELNDGALFCFARHLEADRVRRVGFWDEYEMRELLESVRLELGVTDLREVKRAAV